MNQAITAMPILNEPEKLSKQVLLDKCREQQQTMILQDAALQRASDQLVAICGVANRLGAHLDALVDAYDEGDQDAISVHLRQLSDNRKTFKKPEVH